MKRKLVVYGFFFFFLNNGAAILFPQNTTENTTIAVVPFKGNPDNIINDFGEVLQQALPKAGPYTQYLVDMNNLPDDVPEGGFPPYVCPSPSMTNNAPYALTGEVTPDADDPSNYHLRLYLWEMENNRLVFSDELTAPDRESCELSLPSLLNWILSWIKDPEAAPKTEVALPAPEPEHWLYLGLRGGSSLRFYSRERTDPFLEQQVMHYYNINLAFQAAVHLLKYLDIQTEINYTSDYAPFTYTQSVSGKTSFSTEAFSSQSLMIPLLARSTMRKKPLMAGALGGIYVALPIGKMTNNAPGFNGAFDYGWELPLGYTLGINIGMKAGPGTVFLDVRWAADFVNTLRTDGELLYRRSMITFNIGYEYGLIPKRKKDEKPANSAVSPPAAAQ